jgi:hypothetical protein
MLLRFCRVSALDDCEAEPLADWSPVVVVDVVPCVCAPDVVFASTLDDWLPVVVALSMVRLERPRRSMFGLKVEVEPVTDEFTSVEAPDWVAVVPELEPVFDGLAVALPLALVLAPCDALVLADGAEAALESGTQSWCTALDECSAALPVDLFASLPAFLLLSSLHSGFEAVWLVDMLFCAKAGAAPRSAASAKVLR